MKGICDSYAAFLLAIQSTPGTVNETSCPSLPTVTIVNDPNQGAGIYCASIQGNSYQWYMDNQPLVGATQQCYNIPVDLGATYQVEVFFDNGCVLSQPITMTNGMVEHFGSNISIFPNPVADFLNIAIDWEGEKLLKIFDNQGRMVKQANTKSKEIKIDCQDLTGGFYTIAINSENLSFSKKFIKK